MGAGDDDIPAASTSEVSKAFEKYAKIYGRPFDPKDLESRVKMGQAIGKGLISVPLSMDRLRFVNQMWLDAIEAEGKNKSAASAIIGPAVGPAPPGESDQINLPKASDKQNRLRGVLE